jgi:holo-[acyl-carrier protein] synthase
MVVGLGLDIASVQRIARLLDRFGARFSERILTALEREDLARRTADPAQFVAGRFAAKEAAAKALGGPSNVWWHDVQVRRGPGGRPELEFLGEARAHADRLSVTRTWLSITHDGGVAAAVVILENIESSPGSGT